MCGEKDDPVTEDKSDAGSPPRVRGKVNKFNEPLRRGGITPACAGKRVCTTTATTRRKDHPRVCGEKCRLQHFLLQGLGSPPRVRGKGTHHQVEQHMWGITPACAGKSGFSPFLALWVEDHPRVCGEKLTTFDAGKLIPGSPPRVRGKVSQHSTRPLRVRIAPACAGKRGRSPSPSRPVRDHPRVCGEKSRGCTHWPIRRGSPPRVRGKAYH